MLNMFDNSDEYDFTPTEGSKLSSLFGSGAFTGDISNHDLMYTAPKQPKPAVKLPETTDPVKTKPQPAVLCAKIITLWKLEDSKYKPLGKHGLAIIGSAEQNLYEIVIYKEKTNILVRIPVNENYNLLNQNDNFSTFYDTASQNWLMKFDNATEQSEFSKEVQQYNGKIVDNSKSGPQKDEAPSEEKKPDSTAAQTRADILSRVVKMGQQILPDKIAKNTSTDLSDSELEESRHERKVTRKVKKVQHSDHSSDTSDIIVESNQQMVGVTTQFLPPQQMPHHPFVMPPTVNYDSLGYVVAQNTELKINLAQISSKLDAVLQGVGQVSNKPPIECEAASKAKIKALELRSDNLTSEIQKMAQKYADLEKKYQQLQNQTQEPTKRPETEIIIDEQRLQISKFKLRLSEALNNSIMADNRAAMCETEMEDLKKTVEIQDLKLKDLEAFHKANENNQSLLEEIDELKKEIANLKLKLKDFEEYHRKNEEGKKEIGVRNKEIYIRSCDLIKKHMDSMYMSLAGNLDPNTEYSASDVQGSIAKNIKSSTYKMLQELQGICIDKSKIEKE